MPADSENKWSDFCNFSKMRQGIISWYDFKDYSDVLEIGADYGVITKVLCDKCNSVTSLEKDKNKIEILNKNLNKYDNLNLFQGTIENFETEKKFDYVVWIGGLETYKRYNNALKKIYSLLKHDGILLLAVENRFGIKYFCGYKDPYTNSPFAGINNYNHKGNGRAFSRKELDYILSNSGFINRNYYYPMPDYKAAQVIFTDEYQPINQAKERIITYYKEKDTLLAYDKDLYEDIVYGKALGFLNNSYFIEASKEAIKKSMKGAFLSGDREDSHAHIVKVYSNGIVKKEAASNDAIESLKNTCNNSDILISRGISMIGERFECNSVVMPYIKCNSGMDYICTMVKKDKNRVEELLDNIYKDILNSSDASKEIDCEFYVENMSWDKILKYAYIDMIPLNLFVKDGKPVYYDQEFVRTNCPSQYVIFRTVYYMYLLHPEINNYIGIDDLKNKYRLVDVWDNFINIENKFVEKNRDYNNNKYFMELSVFDKRLINKNINKLMK